MIRIFTVIFISTLISPNSAASVKDNAELSDYLWKKRPLLLFAPSPDSPVYRSVPENLSVHLDQIVDRHMVIIEVFENGMIRIDGNSGSRHSAASLRQRFSAEEGGLTAILVGKDGGLKLRQNGRLDLDEIFSLIDTMPMRQQEMRKSMIDKEFASSSPLPHDDRLKILNVFTAPVSGIQAVTCNSSKTRRV